MLFSSREFSFQGALVSAGFLVCATFLFAAPSSAHAAVHAYVANFGSGTVSVIDTTTNTVVQTVTVGTNPWGVATTGTGLYVANQGSNSVSIIDLTNNVVEQTISVGTAPVGVALSGTGLYVACSSSNNVYVIDTTTNTVERTISVGTSPRSVIINGTGAFVPNYNSNNVSVIDTTTLTVDATVSVGTNPEFGGVASGTGVYISNVNSDNVSVIDRRTNTVARTITVGDGPNGIALYGTGAYVANRFGGSISVIDIVRNTVAKTISLSASPFSIAVQGTYAYITRSNGSIVSVLDLTNDTVLTTITVGSNPYDIVMGQDVDISTQAPTLSSPASTTLYGRSMTVTFTLPETALANSVTLNFNDGASNNITLTLTDTTSASFTLDLSNVSASAHVATATADIIPEADYTVTLSYQDANGNAAATDSNTRVTTAATSECPANYAPGAFASLRYGDHCYAYYTTERTYLDANAACQTMLGTLAAPTTSARHGILRSLGSFAWIGLSDVAEEDNFAWVDGSTLSYTNWADGQPEGGTAENCVRMENGHLWHDYPCEDTFSYFCQLPVTTASQITVTTGGGGGGRRANIVHLIQEATKQFKSSDSSSVSSQSVETSIFSDVRTADWFYPYIKELYVRGIVGGYKDPEGNDLHLFGPADSVTYGQLAKMVTVLIGGKPAGSKATMHWAEPYVRAARETGLSVYQNEQLNLDTEVPRGAVVRTILEAYGISLAALPQSRFSDLPADSEYATDILTAVALNIMSGDKDSTTIRPQDSINRAEVVKLLTEVSARFSVARRVQSSAPSSAATSSASSISSTVASTGKDVRYVETAILNVRADARINSALLWTARQGQEFEVLRIVGEDWAHVRVSDGNEGYVWVHYLSQ